jgi:hypothetical protein
MWLSPPKSNQPAQNTITSCDRSLQDVDRGVEAMERYRNEWIQYLFALGIITYWMQSVKTLEQNHDRLRECAIKVCAVVNDIQLKRDRLSLVLQQFGLILPLPKTHSK